MHHASEFRHNILITHNMPAKLIVFLMWPGRHGLIPLLVEELFAIARKIQPTVSYDVVCVHVDMQAIQRGQAEILESLDQSSRVFLLSDECPQSISPALSASLRTLASQHVTLGGLAGGVYPLAQLGLLDNHRAAVHWRWHDDFTERYSQTIATNHLFESDRLRLTACGGMAVVDLFLDVLAQDYDARLAADVSEDFVVERVRSGRERQRMPLRNRMGSVHPQLTQAVELMEANIEEPLTTDEIAIHIGCSRRQLERIFRQFLDRVPSQYYVEMRLDRARQMLLQSSRSIIQVGLSCGFSSGSHFSVSYRKHFGITPREDRSTRRAKSLGAYTPGPSERG